MSIGTFWNRICACERAVDRESKPERDTFEMMVNFEKDLAMIMLGENHCRCGKQPLLRTKVTKLNKWLSFHCQPLFHAWDLAYTSATMNSSHASFVS